MELSETGIGCAHVMRWPGRWLGMPLGWYLLGIVMAMFQIVIVWVFLISLVDLLDLVHV